MPKEVNLFTYCGSSQMKEKLWRDMFIAHIFGVDMPEDIEVRRLSDSIKNGISGKEFSPALASLLILYGGGYIDDDAFIRIMPDCENYSDEIDEVEKILVEQGNDEGEDRYNGRIIQNVLLCAAFSKKFDEMQQIDIQSALALYDSTYTIISDGFVHLKDKEFLGMLLENDIEFAAVITDGKNISLEKLTKLDIQNGLDNGDFNDLKEYVDRLMKGEKPSELSIKDCVLLDIKDIAYLTAVYKKPYYKDFLKYVKSENIPFDDNFAQAYEEYVHKCKMKFIIRVYPRRRKICTKFPCWFDYNVPDNKAQEVVEIDLTKVVGNEVEYADEKLTNIALDRYLRSRAMIPETVLEITHGENVYFFIMKTDKEYDRLDNDSFRKIPFDFDDIWTTISEWSRDKKIRKELVGGKPEIIVTPESEWEKIKPRDREYAKRLLEEQIQLKETSLLKTLAYKHRSSVAKMKAKYQSETVDERTGKTLKCLKVTVERDGKRPLTAQWGGISLAHQKHAVIEDTPYRVYGGRTELIKRLLANQCELCGSTENIEVHHIRKLADLNEKGRKEKPAWVQIMATRKRKTLVLCHNCHVQIHGGRKN